MLSTARGEFENHQNFLEILLKFIQNTGHFSRNIGCKPSEILFFVVLMLRRHAKTRFQAVTRVLTIKFEIYLSLGILNSVDIWYPFKGPGAGEPANILDYSYESWTF